MAGKSQVTIVIRPEHARLTARTKTGLPGILRHVVFFGTDTHYHVDLDACGEFIVREQNNRGAAPAFKAGDKVSIAIGENAAQMLRD